MYDHDGTAWFPVYGYARNIRGRGPAIVTVT